jgi:hypothetical protein
MSLTYIKWSFCYKHNILRFLRLHSICINHILHAVSLY